jgi:lysophospholipase L1-like esterase
MVKVAWLGYLADHMKSEGAGMSSGISRLQKFSGSRWGQIFAWGLLVLSLVNVVVLILMAIKGGPLSGVIHATHPQPRFGLVFCGWFGWFFLRYGLNYSRRQWFVFSGRLVLCAFSTALACLVAEVGLRVILKRTQESQSLDRLDAISSKLTKETISSSHPLAAIVRRSSFPGLVYELQPRLVMDFGHHWVRINSSGMRDVREYPEAKGTNTFRIVGLGDSGMFGWDVEQEDPYMAVLGRQLNARGDGRDYEVLNFGVPGYNTQLELEMLKCRALAFAPDIVVIGWCDNDFNYPFFIPQKSQWSRKNTSFLYYLVFNRQKFAEIALNRISDMREYKEGNVPEHFKGGTDISGVKQCFTEIMELSRKHRFNVLVFGPMQREAVEICKEVDVPYFNTHERIAETQYPSEYLVHYMHPAPAGHRVLAEFMEKELRSLGWLPNPLPTTPPPPQ